MRKIELDMLKAIRNRKDWKNSNTMVEPLQDYCNVYLHGSHIAEVYVHPLSGRHTVKVNEDTLLEYPTRTTLSRLRALDVDVYIRKGVVYLNGEPLVII